MIRPENDTRRARRGFTIIELLMVMVLISIMASWAIPKMSLARFRADAAGRLARTLIQSSQRNAITRQSDVIVSFDLVNNSFRMVQDYNNNDTLNSGDKVDFRSLEEGAHFSKPGFAGPNGTVPASALVGNNLRTVSGLPGFIFRRDGSGTSYVEIYTTTRDNVATEFRAVTLTGATGKTDLWKYNGTIWIRMTQ
jgi:prepilin-type N-terminal cleavage/methylation domain-containing protein